MFNFFGPLFNFFHKNKTSLTGVTIADVALFICAKYPSKNNMSELRLIILVYLCDWLHCQKYKEKLSEITWRFQEYGPYSGDIVNFIEKDDRFIVDKVPNFYGDLKISIKIKDPKTKICLPKKIEDVINSVIKSTEKFYWDELIKYVYSTYPIRQANKYSSLDLVSLAIQESR